MLFFKNRIRYVKYVFFSHFRYLKSLPKVIVRCIPEESDLTISFQIHPMTNREDKFVYFIRSQIEPLNISLEKISSGLQKKLTKYASTSLSQIDINLFKNEIPLNPTLSNMEAWENGSVMRINEWTFEVERNPPMIKSIEVPVCNMVGFPIYPKINFEFCDSEYSEFLWLRDSTGEKIVFTDSESSNCTTNWEEVSSSLVYTPINRDIGRSLKFICIPKSKEKEGSAFEVILPLIKIGPGFCFFENRHLFTSKCSENDSIRIVTYNILAQIYASTSVAKTLLFPHCPNHFLDSSHRNQILLKEILGYNADVLCLQEVDKNFYNSHLIPSLSIEGFSSEVKLKNDSSEGLAVFYRRNKFRLLGSDNIILAQALKYDRTFKELLDKISENTQLLDSIVNKSTVLQVVILECLTVKSKIICVANVHLYFSPEAHHIRLLQTLVCMKHIENIVQHYKDQYPSYEISVLFCGDFNSGPKCGVYNFLTKGHLVSNFHEITNAGDESLDEITLCHSFHLDSACGIPDYTNYVPTFFGTLDYIFYDCNFLKVSQVIPMPTDEEVQTYQALPNVIFPSDHIALISDLTWLKS